MSIHPTSTIVRLGMLCLAAAALAFPAAATAARTQESMLQDDPQLLGASQAQLDQRLGLLKVIGVDRLRVSVFWGNIAPADIITFTNLYWGFTGAPGRATAVVPTAEVAFAPQS